MLPTYAKEAVEKYASANQISPSALLAAYDGASDALVKEALEYLGELVLAKHASIGSIAKVTSGAVGVALSTPMMLGIDALDKVTETAKRKPLLGMVQRGR